MSSQNLNDLSQKELNKILKEEHEKNKKRKKERTIQLIKKLQKQNEKLAKDKNGSKIKRKPKPKEQIKTFDEYFQECIKNKTIPKDTPDYLKKALERAIKEYNKGIKHEKSALLNFAEKYIIDGKPKLIPESYFSEKIPQLIEFKNISQH